MATISGALLFDNARTGVSSPSMPGISGVPIVLQNTATNAMLAVTTDANGRYTFLNVPNGTYRIVEAYGTTAGPSPGDFSQAQAGGPAVAAAPPISFAPSASPAANQLDAVTPNPLNTTVSGADITGQDILNGPVQVPADIAVTKEPEVEIATIGNSVTYVLTITNNGPGLARNIVLTDQVPASLQNVEYSTDGGTVWNTWTGEFRREAMASNTNYFVLLRGTVAPSAGDTIDNTATVAASTADPNSGNNSSTSSLPVDSVANLGITKRANRTSVRPGETIIYTITTTNSGPGEARSVTVTDNVPLTLTNAEYSADNGASWQPWGGTFTIGTMANGASSTLLLRAVVSQTATGSVGNLARVDSFTPDPMSGNTRSYVEVPISTSAEPSADLSVAKQANQSAVRPGDTLIYTLTVRNGGPNAAASVVLADNVTPALTNAEYSTNNGASWQPWNGSLALGTMASGAASATLLRGVVASSATESISNTATVSSATADPNSSNNSATLQTTMAAPIPPSADLSVAKQANQSTVRPGDTLIYTLTVRNGGPNAAASVVLADNVAPALTNAEYSTNNGASWQPWNGSLALGTMANGTSSATLLRGVVAPSATGSISNTATVSSATADPNSSNNSAALQTTVAAPVPPPIPPSVPPSADLSVTKQANQSTVRPGDTLIYTLTVRNGGPNAAASVVLADNVAPALTNAEYSTNSGASWQPWNGSLALGTMASGASSTIFLRGVVASSATGSISNTATVNSATADPNSSNNSATLQTTVAAPVPPSVPPSADLSVTKQANQSTVRPGDTLAYTLTVRNGGPNAAATVVLADNVAPALTNAEYSTNSGASWQTWNGSLALGTMASGASSTMFLRGVVVPSATGSISNTATISSATADPNSSNNSATLQTTVAAPATTTTPRLSLTKTIYPCTASPCRCITFTISIANAGTAEATDVLLTDAPPRGICNVHYSLNNGSTWQPWPGKLAIGSIPAGSAITVVLRGVVSRTLTHPLKTLTKVCYKASGKGLYTEQSACIVPLMRCRHQRF